MGAEWLKNNTFHHQDFADIGELVKRKEKQGLSISVGLPTLNVENTLEKILVSLKNNLMKKFPLIDQLAIIDSHSKDKTVKIAKDLGVEVYYDDKLITSAGHGKGKGEALWKSLAALHGDIVLWVDSDIKNFHPRFVYGLAGPLIKYPKISYIKAYYQRPIMVGHVMKATGGGRVTELVTRPFLNMFYPELSGFIQPLSGEYGGRREVLESIPFYSGYAVETAMLIHVAHKFGLKSMAQVDLEERIHHNQTLPALGKMAFGIMQAAFEILDQDKIIKLKAEPAVELKQLRYKKGKYLFRSAELKIEERSSINTVHEYQLLRKEFEEQRRCKKK